MSNLLRDPAQLRRHLDELLDAKKRRTLSRDEREALAECSFRLGVDRRTPVQQAISHLNRAYKYDGTNPKFAYHLALLYYLHGDLPRATVWIQTAVRQCPTSHRIWTHISLLQKELFTHYNGNQNFDYKIFQDNSRTILEAIGAKHDHFADDLLVFTPPPSEKVKEEQKSLERDGIGQREEESPLFPSPGMETALTPGGAIETVVPKLSTMPRLVDPNRCRWSGILDLQLDAFFELDYPSRFKEMVPLMDEIARIAPLRPRGISAFVVSAIFWLVLGYPLATIRRLRATLGTASDRALQLLDLVCELYEASDDELSAQLAEALKAKRLPPYLAALIHQRRLLWYPLEFKGVEDYRAARRYVNAVQRLSANGETNSEETEIAITEHIKNLRKGVRGLYPSPPKPLEDFVPKPAAPSAEDANVAASSQDPLQRLADLSKLVADIKAHLDRDWDRLLQIEAAQKSGALDGAALSELGNLATSTTTTRQQCSNAIEELEQLGKNGDLFSPDTNAQIDRTLRAFRKELIRPNTFQKKLDKLPVPKPAAADANAATSAVESTKVVKVISAPPPIGDDNLKGLHSLERALLDTDRALLTFFKRAQASFEAYPPASLQLSPIKSLRAMVIERTASVLYRLGRRKVARKLWHTLLLQDRLDVNLLKNIAVCDLRDQDVVRALESWRSYIEMLYFYDIVYGSPRPHARARAEFHREFGNAYAPAFLQAKLDAEWDKSVDDTAFSVFLDSPSRLRHFVSHKLLEFLNAKLDFTSPLMVLGVRNYDSDKARLLARDNLLAFATDVCELLPERVRLAFAETCRRHIHAAWKACNSAKRLVRENDPNYAVEEARQNQWLKDVVLLKKKLFILVRNNQELVRHLKSLDFLDQLARFDTVPINQSPDMLDAAALESGFEDGAFVEKLLHDLADGVIVPMLEFVFSDKGTKADGQLRQTQYRRLVAFADNPVLARKSTPLHDRSYLQVIDDPQFFYPEAVQKAFGNEQIKNNAAEILRDWVQRYPHSTGPARLLANLLVRDEKRDQAFELAQQGQLSAVPLLLELLKTELAPEALELLESARRDALTQEGRDECAKLVGQLHEQYFTVARNVVVVMSQLAQQTKKDIGHAELATAGAAWLNRTRHLHAMKFASIPKDEQPFNEDSLEEFDNDLNEAVVIVFLAPLGKLEDNWTKVINATTKLHQKSENIVALYYRMIGWHSLAHAAWQKENRTETIRCLRHAALDAALVTAKDKSPKHREHAEQVRKEVSEVLRE